MRSFTRENVSTLYGKPVYGNDGQKIGDVGEFLFDVRTREPEWVSVDMGLFGMKSKLVPLNGAGLERDGLQVPFSKDKVKDAPGVSISDGAISEADERELWNYYGVTSTAGTTDTGLAGRPASGQFDRDREVAGGGRSVELREEELRVQKERHQAGEVEVRKDVVTEQRSMEVPVTREEVYVERHPATNREASGGTIGEGETIRVPIHEEEIHVEKRPVVREELEIGKRQVSETEHVSGTVRREEAHIERTGDVEMREEGDTGNYGRR